jgi:beta-glucanase (GH16 family)
MVMQHHELPTRVRTLVSAFHAVPIHASFRLVLILAIVGTAITACGGNGDGAAKPTTTATPAITSAAALGGAQIVTLSDSTSGATIYFTLDGSIPGTSSQVYEGPLLIASNLTVKAMASSSGLPSSSVASQSYAPNIASGTLVWSDEFNNSSGVDAEPNPQFWTYDTGSGGFGNDELENYCAWNSSTSPCSASSLNTFVDGNGYLNIVARQPSAGVYTSARLKTQGLLNFQYGRLEIRAQVPEAQGFWPAAWLLGSSYATISWPACGEMDVLERVNAASTPDWVRGSVHGTGFTGTPLGVQYNFPSGETAAQWHTYGMIWSVGSVSYYVDNPAQPYATFTPSSLNGYGGSVWPFDAGPSFIILDLAVGGTYPGSPNSSTPFPSTMLVDYVRIYTN